MNNMRNNLFKHKKNFNIKTIINKKIIISLMTVKGYYYI